MMGLHRRHPPLSGRAASPRFAQLLHFSLALLRPVRAAPFFLFEHVSTKTQEGGKSSKDPSLWLYLGVAAILVLLGGAFAGLTIALMGQDEIYLQVIKTSGDSYERRNASKVLSLLKRGKHWVLVTLLLSNVITNETLPIVLDRSLGGGWPAVLGSTVLIVIFGEIAPQSVCVRYGLPIGAWMSPFVLALMYILAPIAWPTAKLLDWLLGEDHGTIYKKAGLKTLVSLHRTLGEAGQQLNSDEVTIISAVLDLKDKPVGSIMTPMEDVFTLSLDDILDEETMDNILSQGYSRIPIHHPDNSENFVGMLLVKMLITYDPEDAKPVRDFALATLPETAPDTSCLDIVNFFQEGKSHMVLVSAHPGDDHGALGVVTLEDVIEELIGEEIIDESDVYIDVHKAIRRLNPAPRTRITRSQGLSESPTVNGVAVDLINIAEDDTLSSEDVQREEAQRLKVVDGAQTRGKAILQGVRRRSSATNSNVTDFNTTKRPSTDELREHLRHIGPSNLASRPKATRYASVKIKPGNAEANKPTPDSGRMTPPRRISLSTSDYQAGIGEDVLGSGGKEASDAVQAIQQHQGGPGSEPRSPDPPKSEQIEHSEIRYGNIDQSESRGRRSPAPSESGRSHSTIMSLPRHGASRSRSPTFLSNGPARSGSITENVVDAHGIRKVVLETTSSSSSNEDEDNSGANKGRYRGQSSHGKNGRQSGSVSLRGGDQEDGDDIAVFSTKKRRRRKKKSPQRKSEEEPLLG